MRGLTSHDGKMTGNVQTVGAYDKSKGKKPAMEHGGGGMDQPIHEVVAEHGPAHQHLITKHDDGHFSSHTMHEDGHKHGPVHHDSLDDAHDHGRQAMEDTEHNENTRDSEQLAEGRDESEAAGGMGSKRLSFME